jgi:antitoxin (DNA-binding transcriptional repressor) of toxin-antitoxin stability system
MSMGVSYRLAKVGCTSVALACTIRGMALTISNVRQNLFALADAAAQGELVEFTHKGRTFRLTVEPKMSKLDRLKGLDLLPEGVTQEDLDQALQEVGKEAYAAWEKNQRIFDE